MSVDRNQDWLLAHIYTEVTYVDADVINTFAMVLHAFEDGKLLNKNNRHTCSKISGSLVSSFHTFRS
jgi:hypothetical protein